MTPEIRAETERLLSAFCDEGLSDSERLRLEELLRGDPACQNLYLSYLSIHAQLASQPMPLTEAFPPERCETEVVPERPVVPDVGRKSTRGRPTGRWLAYAAVAVANIAALSGIYALVAPGNPTPAIPPPPAAQVAPPPVRYVATLLRTAGCVWDGTAVDGRDGTRLSPAELSLRWGVAEILFDGGTTLVLQGPARLRVESRASATLLGGQVVFRNHDMAAPFRLHTPRSTLTDVGTEYAVTVRPDGEEVHVFDGEVWRSMPNVAGPAEVLSRGQARRYTAAPDARGEMIPLGAGQFVRAAPAVRATPGAAAAGLLAYEGFDYQESEMPVKDAGTGGSGWAGAWYQTIFNGGHVRLYRDGLTRTEAGNASRGKCVGSAGHVAMARLLEHPIPMDQDGIYYFSYLFRREKPTSASHEYFQQLVLNTARSPNAPSRATVVVRIAQANGSIMARLEDSTSIVAAALEPEETYLLTGKLVTGRSRPDQLFVRVYHSAEPVDADEPNIWSVVTEPFQSEAVIQKVTIVFKGTAPQSMDEFRLGTTWQAVTAPWLSEPAAPAQ